MASLLRFMVNPTELQNAIKIKHEMAESSRLQHFIAARKIQVSHNPAERDIYILIDIHLYNTFLYRTYMIKLPGLVPRCHYPQSSS